MSAIDDCSLSCRLGSGVRAVWHRKPVAPVGIGKKSAVAVRLGGMGVAIGWEVGKELSGILSEL